MGLDMYYSKASKGISNSNYFDLRRLLEDAEKVNNYRSKTEEEFIEEIRYENATMLDAIKKYFVLVLDPEEERSILSKYNWTNFHEYISYESFERNVIDRTVQSLETTSKEVDEEFDRLNITFEELEDCVANGYYEEAGYQRKANAVHGWIVDNVQDGVDDCRVTIVPKETIEEFIDLCNMVLENPQENSHLIPPVNGFFFGDTEIDEYYVEDIENAKSIFENALNAIDFNKEDFLYESSW